MAGAAGEQSSERIRNLPEFQAHAKNHECLVQEGVGLNDVTQGLTRDRTVTNSIFEVHTLVPDGPAKRMTLWNRFVVSSAGDIMVWDRWSRTFITLAQWRSQGQW